MVDEGNEHGGRRPRSVNYDPQHGRRRPFPDPTTPLTSMSPTGPSRPGCEFPVRPNSPSGRLGMVDRSAASVGARLLADTELRHAAGRFFQLMGDAGVCAAPIKGLAVSAALYLDPIARPFGDVDVLVSRADVPRVIAVARRRGFRLVYDSKQLDCVNVVMPPGIPFDVRASIGPPGFAGVSASEVLARSSIRTDIRVHDGPVRWLRDEDHLLVLLVDALIDKLAVKVEQRAEDLRRALAAWVDSPERFAAGAHRAGLAAAAQLVLRWLAQETGDDLAWRCVAALEPLPFVAAAAARLLRAEPWVQDPHGPVSRIGTRFVADNPLRALGSLGLGAIGVVRYWAHNRGRSPWKDVLWRGPPSGPAMQ
jgi:Uncharacterised nucleotidyltransferase